MINVTKIRQLIEKEDEGPTLDYKEDLNLQTDGDKAQFIKDVLSLANGGQVAHIISGVQNGTRKLVGIKTSHKPEQLNDILKGKCNPSLTVEYGEKTILGHKVGVMEVDGENRPYVVGVHDRYGGHLSANPKKECYVYRGMVFIRNFNKNEGACRADLDTMYQIKYVTLQPDLELLHEVSVKSLEDLNEVGIDFRLINIGDVLATSVYARLRLYNIEKIVSTGVWQDISKYNEDKPTMRFLAKVPICPGIPLLCNKVKVNVKKSVKQIEAHLWLGATNMRMKEGSYVVALKQEE